MTAKELERQPAFPHLKVERDNWGDIRDVVSGNDGPTLLIEFTKAAMQGLCSCAFSSEEEIPNIAVTVAKATLAELAKEL